MKKRSYLKYLIYLLSYPEMKDKRINYHESILSVIVYLTEFIHDK